MAFEIRIGIAAEITGGRNAFSVRLPTLVVFNKLTNEIVRRDCAGKAVVRCHYLAGGHHEVVADRGMGVRVVVGCEGVLVGEAVQVRHRTATDHVGVAGILFDNDNDMIELCNSARRGVHARIGVTPAAASETKYQSHQNRCKQESVSRGSHSPTDALHAEAVCCGTVNLNLP